MKAPAPIHLTPRDLAILGALSSYRFLSLEHLTTLFFAGKTSAASARLRKLLAHKLILRIRPGVERGEAKVVYGLAGRGARELTARFPLSRPTYVKPSEVRTGLFVNHTLRRNELRITLLLLSRSMPEYMHLLSWLQERDEVGTEVRLPRARGKALRVPLVPDGYFALKTLHGYQSFVVEIDTGSVRAARMELRYRAYWHWWRTRAHRAHYGGAPLRVLTITSSSRRLARLHGLATSAPGRGRGKTRLFWFAQMDDVLCIRRPEVLLEPRWSVSSQDVDEQQSLLPELSQGSQSRL